MAGNTKKPQEAAFFVYLFLIFTVTKCFIIAGISFVASFLNFPNFLIVESTFFLQLTIAFSFF